MILPAVLLALASGMAFAGTAATLPQSFDHVGTIDAVDLGTNTIVVGDVRLNLAPDLQVYGPRQEQMSAGSLAKGQQVGLQIARGGAGAKTVYEIWIIPPGSDLESNGTED